jgi:aminopeptidase-like protein
MTNEFLLSTEREREAIGQDLSALIARLYPICRSKTGNGVRETMRIIDEFAGLEMHEVPSGSQAYDWTVPKEWNVTDAWVSDSRGRRVIDFRQSNLHLLGYSIPVHRKMSLAELRPHLHSLPDRPDWIPFCNTFHREDWGFALRHADLEKLEEGEYEVCVDSTLKDGHLTYGEAYLPGATPDEILISAHSCHPSLCNDNLSGIAIAALLARRLHAIPHRYSYRFLFLPGTIGSIIWLSRNEDKVSRIKHGIVLACLGDPGNFTYAQSRRGNAPVDRAFAHLLRHSARPHRVKPFEPEGYDQRQYCSPGFNLPVGSLMRTPYGAYPEYHTSADDLSFVKKDALADSYAMLLSGLFVLENDRKYLNLSPKCEPHLGQRGLYGQAAELGLWWLLNLSDGENSLLDIAERSGKSFEVLKRGADALQQAGLLRPLDGGDGGTTGAA